MSSSLLVASCPNRLLTRRVGRSEGEPPGGAKVANALAPRRRFSCLTLWPTSTSTAAGRCWSSSRWHQKSVELTGVPDTGSTPHSGEVAGHEEQKELGDGRRASGEGWPVRRVRSGIRRPLAQQAPRARAAAPARRSCHDPQAPYHAAHRRVGGHPRPGRVHWCRGPSGGTAAAPVGSAAGGSAATALQLVSAAPDAAEQAGTARIAVESSPRPRRVRCGSSGRGWWTTPPAARS